MSSKILLTVVCLIGMSSAVRADMIEVKGKGVLSGKVVSQSDAQVVFKDTGDNVYNFSRADVLYLDGASTSVTQDEPVAQKIRQAALEFIDWIKRLPAKYKKVMERGTEKLVGKMSKPIDRSGANAKADSLAAAMDQASKASVALSKKNLKINHELAKSNDDFIKETNEKSKKGRFSSLD